MKFESIRQALRPLFGVERRGTTARFLHVILLSGLSIVLVMILLHFFSGATFSNSSTLYTLTFLFVLQALLLFAVRRGYVDQAARALVVVTWATITYQAWSADGIRDVAIYVYIVAVFIAALLTNWRISIVIALVSVCAIWFFAITEVNGLRTPNLDSPLNIARDLTAIFSILLLLIYLMMNTVRHSWNAVREEEEKFRRIFHVSPVAIAIVSLKCLRGRLPEDSSLRIIPRL